MLPFGMAHLQQKNNALLCNPAAGINRLTILANLKIKTWNRLTTAVTNMSDHAIGRDPFAGLYNHVLIVPVQTQVPVTVLDNDEQTHALQPVRINNPAMVNGTDIIAGSSRKQHTVPLQPSIST
jgi:hypothetical protein